MLKLCHYIGHILMDKTYVLSKTLLLIDYFSVIFALFKVIKKVIKKQLKSFPFPSDFLSSLIMFIRQPTNYRVAIFTNIIAKLDTGNSTECKTHAGHSIAFTWNVFAMM